MKHSSFFIGLAAAVFAVLAALAAFELSWVGSVPAYRADFAERTGAFAVVADLQRTMWPERLVLGREHNERDTRRLLEDLARQPVDFVAALGDLVAWEGRANWCFLDQALAPVREAGLPVLPLVGNHEGWGSARFLTRRFPFLADSTWYARTYRKTRILWLDSNLGGMSGDRRSAQKQWLARTLEAADRDPAIRSVLLLDHHPPFTNSEVTGDDPLVQEDFLPPFLATRKTIALISGHAHAYERFTERGRTFVVAGGGGGPRVALRQGERRRHADLVRLEVPRPFHYLVVRPREDGGLDVTVRGFRKDEAAAAELERFAILAPEVAQRERDGEHAGAGRQ